MIIQTLNLYQILILFQLTKAITLILSSAGRYIANHPQESSTDFDNLLKGKIKELEIPAPDTKDIDSLINTISDESLKRFLDDPFRVTNNLDSKIFSDIINFSIGNESIKNNTLTIEKIYDQNSQIKHDSTVLNLLKKMSGELGNNTLNEIAEKVINSELIQTVQNFYEFINVDIVLSPLSCLTGLYTFSKLVKLYETTAFKNLNYDKPELLRLRNRQLLTFMVFGALPFTYCLLNIIHVKPAKKKK